MCESLDIIAALLQQPDYQTARNYWKVLKNRLKKEGSESVTKCNQLKLPAADGKSYLTDVAAPATLLRIIQIVDSAAHDGPENAQQTHRLLENHAVEGENEYAVLNIEISRWVAERKGNWYNHRMCKCYVRQPNNLFAPRIARAFTMPILDHAGLSFGFNIKHFIRLRMTDAHVKVEMTGLGYSMGALKKVVK